ncbi:hypothetical protein ACN2C7_06240 [Caulobacter sp. ErkDOM-E]|uniref:hypothetical protein n=1 Tax=Caulobacter sp. ErkDOM-E TaxID=3402778 RepID=UPI003AF88181
MPCRTYPQGPQGAARSNGCLIGFQSDLASSSTGVEAPQADDAAKGFANAASKGLGTAVALAILFVMPAGFVQGGTVFGPPLLAPAGIGVDICFSVTTSPQALASRSLSRS